jgi:AAA family ATP:ADP antiporter
MALIGVVVSSAATWVAQRAGHAPDLLPEAQADSRA